MHFRMFAAYALLGVCMSAHAAAATLGGALTLADEGSFFVNGQVISTKFPGASLATAPADPGRITVNQMYVHYRVPAAAKGVPVVMVHGSNHTGMTYETTPDGREGWATWFVRQGHPVYVVDHSGRGRSGFDPTTINQVRDTSGSNPVALPTLFFGTHERAWINFRFGPAYGKPFPNLQFPLEALDQYFQQLVPNSETALQGGAANTVNALAALLDRIGPAVVMVHSQSGVYGLDLVRKRAQRVLALISIEGGCDGFTAADASAHFTKVPFVSVWGDNSVGAKGTVNGDMRRNACLQAANAIKGAGGRASLLMLPDIGIPGNSHMLMMDRNNLQIADVLRKWIAENAQAK
jgi:pimeloyl-ACP methyl ester carboxylesterase